MGLFSLRRSMLQQLLLSIMFPRVLEAGESGEKAAFVTRFGRVSGRRSGLAAAASL